VVLSFEEIVRGLPRHVIVLFRGRLPPVGGQNILILYPEALDEMLDVEGLKVEIFLEELAKSSYYIILLYGLDGEETLAVYRREPEGGGNS